MLKVIFIEPQTLHIQADLLKKHWQDMNTEDSAFYLPFYLSAEVYFPGKPAIAALS